jgi:hypothetical protein
MTVRIPLKATPGDHVGGLVASLQTVGKNANGQQVVLNQRIGTRVFVRVSGTLAPKVVLTAVHADYDGTLNPVGKGNVEVSYVVHNAGNTDLAVDQAVRVSGAIADSQSVKLPKIALLLPGSSVAERVVLPGLWPQLLVRVTVTAQPLAEPGDTLPGLVTASASVWVWAIPWSLISIVVVLLAIAFVALRIRRRRADPGRPGPVQTGRTAPETPVGVGR